MKLIFQNKKYKRIFSRLSDEDLSFFKSISTVKGCLSAGIEAIKKNQFDIFMDRIKYIPNFEDNHPTGCFRFWNLEKKICQLRKMILIIL